MTGDEDANFIKTLIGVLGALVVFSVVLMYFANAIGGDEPTEEDKQAIADRIAPVGQVEVAPATESVAANAASEQVPSAQPVESGQAPALAEKAPASRAESTSPDDKGKAVYDDSCFACHTSGLAGAPKLGDKAAWEPRIAQGMETLVARAIEGFQGQGGMMPPKGGRDDLADADVKAAVVYMVDQSR
ncbi:MAG: c-type cytochrome [Pseudomonadota bacterium]|nr:c-type cytochrome [Pseudomonadota bacterium]